MVVLFPPGLADTDGPPVTVLLVVTGHRSLALAMALLAQSITSSPNVSVIQV